MRASFVVLDCFFDRLMDCFVTELFAFVDFPNHDTSSSRDSVSFFWRDKISKCARIIVSCIFQMLRACVLVRLCVLVCKVIRTRQAAAQTGRQTRSQASRCRQAAAHDNYSTEI